MCPCIIETSSAFPRKSKGSFGKCLETPNCLAFEQLLENTRKSSESALKSSENRQKSRH